MLDEQLIVCECEGPVAVVTLNRPEKHNALSSAASTSLAATAAAVRATKRAIDAASVIAASPRAEAHANRELRAASEHRDRFRAAAERIVGGAGT